MAQDKKMEMPPLLALLSALVQADSRPFGLNIKLAIIVCSGSSSIQWTADFRGQTKIGVSTDVDSDLDAALIMGQEESDSILTGSVLPQPALVRVIGEKQLLNLFLQHYLLSRRPHILRTTF